ncbi:hypothetical protein [Mycolicibacterium frederiksbergense]|uniref:hypothetical protein n=1 Tax=Mycolicibacterium frederiksbergense TaxID=117567 RepID=UPI0024770377|nr:hypothetical protein [Mycolicibacterium frederiksbergense]
MTWSLYPIVDESSLRPFVGEFDDKTVLGIACDANDFHGFAGAMEAGVTAFGAIDVVVAKGPHPEWPSRFQRQRPGLASGFSEEAGRKRSSCVHHLGSRPRSTRRDARSHRVTKGYPLSDI